MKRPLFLVDLGNTTTRIFCYADHTLTEEALIPTRDLSLQALEAVLPAESAIVISSVVPEKDSLFDAWKPHFVTSRSIRGIQVDVDLDQVGSDRLVTALAAYEMCKKPCLVIDSGTAITVCYVDASGCYRGGAIVPGLKIASQALNAYTAKIPLIYVKPQVSLFGKNTEEAVQCGLYHGYYYLIQGFISHYRKQVPEIVVFGTGAGLEELKAVGIDYLIHDLVIRGLVLVAKQQALISV